MKKKGWLGLLWSFVKNYRKRGKKDFTMGKALVMVEYADIVANGLTLPEPAIIPYMTELHKRMNLCRECLEAGSCFVKCNCPVPDNMIVPANTCEGKWGPMNLGYEEGRDYQGVE